MQLKGSLSVFLSERKKSIESLEKSMESFGRILIPCLSFYGLHRLQFMPRTHKNWNLSQTFNCRNFLIKLFSTYFSRELHCNIIVVYFLFDSKENCVNTETVFCFFLFSAQSLWSLFSRFQESLDLNEMFFLWLVKFNSILLRCSNRFSWTKTKCLHFGINSKNVHNSKMASIRSVFPFR